MLPVLKGEEKASEAQQRRWDEECKEEIETWPIVQAYGLDGQRLRHAGPSCRVRLLRFTQSVSDSLTISRVALLLP